MANKDDLIRIIAQKYFLNKEDAKAIVDTLFDTILEKLDEGEEVRIAGFGKFSIKQRKDKAIYNPTVKEKIAIPSHRVIDFKEGKNAKNKLN